MTDLGICMMIIILLGLMVVLTFTAALTQYNRLEQMKRDLNRAEDDRNDWRDLANELAKTVAEHEKEEEGESFGVITLTREQMEEMCRQYLRGGEWEE